MALQLRLTALPSRSVREKMDFPLVHVVAGSHLRIARSCTLWGPAMPVRRKVGIGLTCKNVARPASPW